ncbi:hypothetical protein MKW98_020223 [Papaver atlanticum]|uniref:F-box domain-containing protein n=1 Tax=Papaver atlanticum TaxID=357466 RepID=A0AAD4S9V9_9MAGN|nr:hypothetical protein MKW98_020223 [Papaver atlanticum]
MEGEEEIDRISRLPDYLIHEILSFIDMKYAVQTSVLSKRWKNIWLSVPFISLHWESFRKGIVYDVGETVDRFLAFVNKVFEFRDESDIEMIKLVIVILNDISVQALNRWILAAVNYNVHHLDVKGINVPNLAYEIPYELFNCKSLKSLTFILLAGGSSDIFLPKSMSLPQIKKLWLVGSTISNLELQMLFSSCPLMEMAIIQKCHVHTYNQINIIIDSQRLDTLMVFDNRHMHLDSDDHFLAYTDKISAPNLKHFVCSGFMTEGFSLQNLSSVVTAQFRMRLREKQDDETAETYSELPAEEKEVFAKRMMKFLGAVHNVRHLTLSSGFLELNLADLGDDWEAGLSLTCMFTHLKVVEIREVEGCENEVKFLRFLLKNSAALEKVNLFFRSTGDSHDNVRQVRRFERNLRVLSTASSNIQMNFI